MAKRIVQDIVKRRRKEAILTLVQNKERDGSPLSLKDADLAQTLGCTSRSVQNYLRELREADLIDVEIEQYKVGGNWVNIRHIRLGMKARCNTQR